MNPSSHHIQSFAAQEKKEKKNNYWKDIWFKSNDHKWESELVDLIMSYADVIWRRAVNATYWEMRVENNRRTRWEWRRLCHSGPLTLWRGATSSIFLRSLVSVNNKADPSKPAESFFMGRFKCWDSDSTSFLHRKDIGDYGKRGSSHELVFKAVIQFCFFVTI